MSELDEIRPSPMQRIYSLEFVFGGVVSAGFTVVLLMSLLPIGPIASDWLIYVLIGLFAAYFPLNLLLRLLDRRSHLLRLPLGISAKAFKRASAFTFLVAVAALAYGFYMWPYAPLRPHGTEYVDKLGHPFTRQQYEAFRRWETAYMSAWGITMLIALLALPFYRTEDRTHVFEGGRQ